MSLLYGM